MAYSTVALTRQGAVAIVSLADPSTLNALTPKMAAELGAAFDEAAGAARCAILTGEGRGFSSGARLAGAALPRDADGQIDLGQSLERDFNPLIRKLRDLPIPFVAAVNGPAAGIGCSLALLADLIVAAESAYFLQAFRNIGLVPDGGATYLLPRMLTRARAMELMLLGERLPAPKALEWGLINRCVPDAELMPMALALASKLAEGPTESLAMTRQLAWRALDATLEDQLQAERRAQREAGRTEDFIEGAHAFAQKRTPVFKGR